MNNLKLTIAGIGLALAASTASAAPFTDNVNNDGYNGNLVNGIPTASYGDDGIPDQYEAVNNVLGTNYTRNSDLDDRFIAEDQLFVGYGSQSVALIGLTAGNSNTLGVYQGATETDVLPYDSFFGLTGNGDSNNPYPGATFNITGDFGWYLDTGDTYGNGDTYYSEADKNAGGWDHMMTFDMSELNGQTRFLEINGQLVEHTFTNAFLLAWEDLPYNYEGRGDVLGDDDFDDMMYIVDFRPTSTEVPEPSMFVLMGLLGLALVRRRTRA